MTAFHKFLLWIGAALFLACTPLQAQAPDYRGIPDGFDYPADKTRLEQYRQAGNLPALRKHGWMLFAGMTQQEADGTPYWETWYHVTETFRPAGSSLQGRRRMTLPFETPNQFEHPDPGLQAPGESVLSFVLFNWEGYHHIRTEHLFERSRLNEINSSLLPSKPWNERKIPDFPARAMTLKTIWWPAKGDGITALPIWDNNPSQPIDQFNVNQFINWQRVVAVDTTRQSVPDGEFIDIPFNSKTFTHSHVVGLDSFYAVKVDDALVQAIMQNKDGSVRSSIQRELGRGLRAGDYMLFIGMHATSKEIADWTWQTFWWHDRPNDGPYAADRPDAVQGVWRNYLMATADDQVLPREPDGTPHIGYNPWLEARFGNGVLSNCMSCHHRASYPVIEFLPVTRGLPDPANDPAFKPRRLQTDFMWSIIDRSK
jgi:hypothetical protein